MRRKLDVKLKIAGIPVSGEIVIEDEAVAKPAAKPKARPKRAPPKKPAPKPPEAKPPSAKKPDCFGAEYDPADEAFCTPCQHAAECSVAHQAANA